MSIRCARASTPIRACGKSFSGGTDRMLVGETEVPSRAYVASFGFKGSDQQKRAGVLSGGERNRLNLALTLKQGGNLLLLDEPTNDLDVETLSSLEAALLEFPGCSVVISHDRMFLDRVATHILAWEGTDENPGNWYWFEGNFESYQENRVARLGEDAASPIASVASSPATNDLALCGRPLWGRGWERTFCPLWGQVYRPNAGRS